MSPRCKKPRRYSCPFKDFDGLIFKPRGISMSELEVVTLYRDELEVLKLCDLEGLTQEEAGEKMEISRGTVQRLIVNAHGKIADAMINGKAIVFEQE
jgi:predicted DNA-binding protein (UPF0251 family)